MFPLISVLNTKEHFLNYPLFNHAKLSFHFVPNSLKGNLHIVSVPPVLIRAKPQSALQSATTTRYKCLFTGPFHSDASPGQ